MAPVYKGVTMRDLYRYDGKTALVVGCYSGMGRAVAELVQSLGAEVHGIDHRVPDLDLSSFTTCDLRDQAQVDAALAAAPARVDTLFYCAGLSQAHPPLDVMSVNLLAMRHVIDTIATRIGTGGSIVSICSFAGMRYAERVAEITDLLATGGYAEGRAWCEAHPEVVGDGYQFSKEVMMTFMLHRSMDLVERGVRYNCTSPGRTETALIHEVEQTIGVELYRSLKLPMDRYGTAEEQAWALAFLNSDAASYITGTNLFVDGGMLAGTITGRMKVPTNLTLPSHAKD